MQEMNRDGRRKTSEGKQRLSLDGLAHGPMIGQPRRISLPIENEHGPMSGQSRRVSLSRINPCFSDEELDDHRGSIVSEDSAYDTIDSIRRTSLSPPPMLGSSPTWSSTTSPIGSLTYSSKVNDQSDDSAYNSVESIRMSSLTSPSTSPSTSPYASLHGGRHLEDILEEEASADQKNRRLMMPLNAANLLWLQQLQGRASTTARNHY